MSTEYPVILGSRGFRLYANEFQGVPKIHIRKQFKDFQTGQVFPTKHGITLSLEEWSELLANQSQISAELGCLAQKASQKQKEKKMFNKNATRKFTPYPKKGETSTSYQQRRSFPNQEQQNQCYRENRETKMNTPYEVPQAFWDDVQQEEIDELFNGPLY